MTVDLFNPIQYIPAYFKVLSKADEYGQSHLVPMNLLPAQRIYLEQRSHRDIVVKPRQVGFSTGVMAANFHRMLVNPHTAIAVVAHKEPTAELLLRTIHRFYNNLPLELKPDSDWKSSARIRFPKLDSIVEIDTAASTTIGRGANYNVVHLSEVAAWLENNAVELHAGISQTVPLGGFICMESTPRGRGGFFYRLYDAAKRGDVPYKPFFFPWWIEPEYKLDKIVHDDALTRDEQMLMSQKGLTKAQIAWRRLKISELGELFFQEYPENDVDCWLTSETGVFDGVALRHYLLQVSEGTVEGNIRWWKRPIGGKPYIIGVDVGAGLPKGDWSVATVLDSRNNEHVATLRARIPPDIFAEAVYSLGRYYNWAVVGVERMGHGLTVLNVLKNKNYPNIYHYRDRENPNLMVQPGWVTSVKTRVPMIDTFAAAIKGEDLITQSANLVKEASAFQYFNGKAQAPPGEHDDELFAMMIALMIRERSPTSGGVSRPRAQSYATI